MDIDYNDYLSAVAKRTLPHALKEQHLVAEHGEEVRSLAEGNPAPETIPIATIDLQLTDGRTIHFTPEETLKALSYTPITGMPEYTARMREFIQTMYEPPCWESLTPGARTAVLPTCGSTDCLDMMTALLLDPGDTIIVEAFRYTGMDSILKSAGTRLIPVPCDGDGMVPAALRDVLSRWDPGAAPGTTDKPRVMYLVPTGHNPTGSTLPLTRKREIYQIAREYRLLICEDDPYYYLINELVPSFLSLDVDGRVLRFDSFSKLLAPGLRAGLMSGPTALVEKARHMMTHGTNGTPGLSQAIIWKLFEGKEAKTFIRSKKGVADMYGRRRDFTIKMADKWLKGLVEYDVPTAGMFLWLKILGCTDTEKLMLDYAGQYQVFVCPGEYFGDETKSYVRVSFGFVSLDSIEKAFERLAKLLKEQVHGTDV